MHIILEFSQLHDSNKHSEGYFLMRLHHIIDNNLQQLGLTYTIVVLKIKEQSYARIHV